MNRSPATILRQISGVSIAVVGLAGLALPVLPGWLLIGAGALILFPAQSRAGKYLREKIGHREDALITRIEERRSVESAQRAA